MLETALAHRGRIDHPDRGPRGFRVGLRRSGLGMSHQVGGHAVEGVLVPRQARVLAARRRRVRQPALVRAAVGRDVHVVAGDSRAGPVLVVPGPSHRNRSRVELGRQVGHLAAGRGGVDRMDRLVGDDGRVDVEHDRGFIADLHAGRQGGLRPNRVRHESLAAVLLVVGGQETGQRAARSLTGQRVVGRDLPGDQPGLRVEVRDDADRVVVVGDGRVRLEVERRRAGRVDDALAKRDLPKPEGRPVEAGVQSIRDRGGWSRYRCRSWAGRRNPFH